MSAVCEYCGCRQIAPLSELMDEHLVLLDDAAHVERLLGQGELPEAMALLARLRERLATHVRREEDGVFTALRELGEFTDEIDDLTQEHRDFDDQLGALSPSTDDLIEQVRAMAAHLTEHIDREDLGIFPVSVVTLGATGWDRVTDVHATQPTFLTSTE